MRGARRSGRSDSRAAAILVASQLAAAAGAFAVNLLAARVMDPTGRGELAFALQLSYFASIVASMGLERPFLSIQAGPFNEQYRYYVRLIAPGICVAAPVAFLVLQLSPLSSRDLLFGGLLVASYVVLDSLMRGVRVAYIASRTVAPFAVNAIGAQLIICTGALVFVLLDVADPVTWFMLYGASGAIALTFFARAVVRTRDLRPLREGAVRELRRRGFKLLPYAFGNTAMLRSDRLLLPYLGNSADLGRYVVVATVMEMAAWPVQQWVDVSLRRWTRTRQGGGRIQWAVVAMRIVGLLIAAVVVLGIACYYAVTLLLPETYHQATELIPLLGIAAFLYGVTRVEQGVLLALGGSTSVSAVELTGTAASIAAYFALIPSHGGIGAAMGSVIGYGICAVFGVGAIWRRREGSTVQR